MVVPEVDVFKLVELAYKIGICCMIPYGYIEAHHRFKVIRNGRDVPWTAVAFFYFLFTIAVAVQSLFWPAALIEETRGMKKQQKEFDPLKDITVFNGFIKNDEPSAWAYVQFTLAWHSMFYAAVGQKWNEVEK